MREVSKGEKGYIVILALIVLVVVGLISGPLLSFMVTGLMAGHTCETGADELYAADAGVQDGVLRITELCPGAPSTQYTIPDINGKDVHVTVTLLSDVGDTLTYKINSIATTGSDSRTAIEAYLEVIVSGGVSVWDNALSAVGGDIDLSGSIKVDSDAVMEGNIYANGDISLTGSVKINGDASATGVVTTTGSSRVQGEETEGATPLVAPDITALAAECESETWGGGGSGCGSITRLGGWAPSHGTYPNQEHVGGTLTISGSGQYVFGSQVCVDQNLQISGSTRVTFNGPVYVQGGLSMSGSGSVTFNGPVIVNGNLSIAGSTDVIFGSTIYVGGDLTDSGSENIQLGGTVYVGGGISMSGSGELVGAQTVIAENSITLSGSNQLGQSEIPLVISVSGSITLSGSNWISAILYAPQGDILSGGSSRLYGCAVGLSIDMSGSSKIVYPIALRSRGDLPGAGSGAGGAGEVAITSWQVSRGPG